MRFPFCINIFSKNDQKKKEECQENFDGELEAKKVKIIGCYVHRASVPERLARLP